MLMGKRGGEMRRLNKFDERGNREDGRMGRGRVCGDRDAACGGGCGGSYFVSFRGSWVVRCVRRVVLYFLVLYVIVLFCEPKPLYEHTIKPLNEERSLRNGRSTALRCE